MGRPPVTLTPDQVREVETLAALLSVQQIADYLGIARSTFFALLERDPDIARHYRRGKAKAIAHVANGLLQRARTGDNTSAIFFLKTQAGWREKPADNAGNNNHVVVVTGEAAGSFCQQPLLPGPNAGWAGDQDETLVINIDPCI